MQDYKSLCAVVMIGSILVNIQTDTQMSTHTDSILISLFDKLSQQSQKPGDRKISFFFVIFSYLVSIFFR